MRRSNRNFNVPLPRPGKPRTFELLKIELFKFRVPSGQNGVQMPYPIVGFHDLSNAPPKEKSSSVPVVDNKASVCIFTVCRDISSRWKAILDAGYAVHGTLYELEMHIN